MDWSHSSLVGAIVIGLVASLSTGLMVGTILARPLPTYHLMVQSFIGSLLTWLITALLTAGLVKLWLDAEAGIATPIAIACLVSMVGILLWQCRRLPERRWGVISALIPWLIVSSGSAIAYFHFQNQSASGSEKIPALFWSCIFYSMALSTLFGACLGGLIFHQTRHLRSTSESTSELPAKRGRTLAKETFADADLQNLLAPEEALPKVTAPKRFRPKWNQPIQSDPDQSAPDPLAPGALAPDPSTSDQTASEKPKKTEKPRKSAKKPPKKFPFDDFEHFL
ncbi:MAG: hypothetical protein VKJ24_19540 [Synechococcales bacterium]|nr:hypothetical protein [Synechococcales bacterium]